MDHWEQDRLGYQTIGAAFTNLIKTVDSAKVISIEAGFGRGKTFFRKAWSEDLRAAGEIVIEIDVQQSDHSGDPVVTLLGALVDALPRQDIDKGRRVIDSVKKLGAVGARTAAKLILRSAADEIIETVTDTAIDKLDDFDALDSVIKELGDGMSKAAGQFIAAQMAAEKVRRSELPEQLNILHSALTQSVKNKRVVIIIDELDRCHPDYAISVLESLKLIFNQSGFVFCLMINANYLEMLAKHRFGTSTGEEKYLDKFVDLRLKLAHDGPAIQKAVHSLTMQLPLAIQFGDDARFSLDHAAEVAGQLAAKYRFSIRKLERILFKVEVAMRCYSSRPLDPSLLIFLAFQDEVGSSLSYVYCLAVILHPKRVRTRLKKWKIHAEGAQKVRAQLKKD
jgi:hypothetical protein